VVPRAYADITGLGGHERHGEQNENQCDHSVNYIGAQTLADRGAY
jgi:hypothetical protein